MGFPGVLLSSLPDQPDSVTWSVLLYFVSPETCGACCFLKGLISIHLAPFLPYFFFYPRHYFLSPYSSLTSCLPLPMSLSFNYLLFPFLSPVQFRPFSHIFSSPLLIFASASFFVFYLNLPLLHPLHLFRTSHLITCLLFSTPQLHPSPIFLHFLHSSSSPSPSYLSPASPDTRRFRCLAPSRA